MNLLVSFPSSQRLDTILERKRRAMTYQSQNRSRRRHSQQRRTPKVKLPHRVKEASPRALQANIVWDHHRRHGHAEEQRRDLDAKLPSPAESFGHGAAEGSSESRAGTEVCGDVGLVGASTSGISQFHIVSEFILLGNTLYRHQVTRDDAPQRTHPPSTKPAKRPRRDKALNTPRQRTPYRRKSKDADAGYKQGLPAHRVGQPAQQRLKRRRREQKGRG